MSKTHPINALFSRTSILSRRIPVQGWGLAGFYRSTHSGKSRISKCVVYFQKSKIEEENMPPVCYTLFYENSQYIHQEGDTHVHKNRFHRRWCEQPGQGPRLLCQHTGF